MTESPQGSLDVALTYTDGDVSRPLIVILTGNHSLADELEPELAFESQYVSVGETAALSEPVQGDARVPAAFFINFCGREKDERRREHSGRAFDSAL